MKSEDIQTEFDRKIYYLKTLYDIGKDLFTIVDINTILNNFLLMTMGNFGVMKGIVIIFDNEINEISNTKAIGFQEHGIGEIKKKIEKFFRKMPFADTFYQEGVTKLDQQEFPGDVICALNFGITKQLSGVLGLSPKISGDVFSEDDEELLVTLVNNLVVALKNAKSFKDIKRLNRDLQDKNLELETALNELQTALKKVEILESIKSNLSKFVPATVSRLIEKSPTAPIPKSHEQDVSVLFLDIQGYTAMSEKLESFELSQLVEQYFSVFMDAIHRNHGDVNETAGDGLMVLFLDEDEKTNALQAVQTATMIRREANLINQKSETFSEPLIINMGINSGRALVGTAKFESYTGSRWTYTARGVVTNVAARIADMASEGEILLSAYTANRIKDDYPVEFLGKFDLKNISEKVAMFSVKV